MNDSLSLMFCASFEGDTFLSEGAGLESTFPGARSYTATARWDLVFAVFSLKADFPFQTKTPLGDGYGQRSTYEMCPPAQRVRSQSGREILQPALQRSGIGRVGNCL